MKITCLCEYMNMFYNLRLFSIQILFWKVYCYSATYDPISMKFVLLVKSQLIHVLTKFRKVLSFRLGFIGFWIYLATPLF